ncbi:unnamed protein product [Merluccius merluccius]
MEQELVMLLAQAEPAELLGTPREKDSRESMQGVLAGESPKTPFTMTRYDPLTSVSTGSIHEARLKVCLTRLRIEAEERAQNREAQL